MVEFPLFIFFINACFYDKTLLHAQIHVFYLDGGGKTKRAAIQRGVLCYSSPHHLAGEEGARTVALSGGTMYRALPVN